jgi:hypothetical protein
MAYRIAETSFYTICVYFFGAAITLWIISGISSKIIALIALLPNVFAAVVGLFTVLAIRWKRMFHTLVSGILIRFVENKPSTVICLAIVFVTGVIAAIARYLHLTAFL